MLMQHCVTINTMVLNLRSRNKVRGNVAYSKESKKIRKLRTHKLIVDVLIELTGKMGFSKVTVREITKYAQINRATFYRHYRDKYQILEEYSQNIYELTNPPPESGSGITIEGIHQVNPAMVAIFEHMATNARFYRVMLGKNGDPAFTEKVRQNIVKRTRVALPIKLRNDKTLLEPYLSYISNGILGTLIWWLENDMPYSPDKLATICYELIIADLNVLLGLSK